MKKISTGFLRMLQRIPARSSFRKFSGKILFFSSLLFLYLPSFSQLTSKMNFGAALAVNNLSKQENTIPLLVQGNVSEIKKTIEQFGGEFRYSIGDISSIELKAKNISLLAEKTFVKRIEAANPFSSTKPMIDSMMIHNRVLPVHQGSSPLLQAYKGKDVVTGFIDTGIDFTHPDFKDTLGKTRIKFLWDQVLPASGPPPPYNYGRQFTANAIDSNLANAHLTTAATYNGHGSHVASDASGNGLAVNHYEAVAPEADIVFVALDFSRPFAILDATDYIYSKAASLGKPCVINASLGDYYGSHDGTNLEAQAMKSLIKAQTGRSFVAAAGNKGTTAFHLGYTASATDTNFTWFYNSSVAYIAMYADANNFNNVQFSIGADKPAPNYSFRGNIPFSTILPHVGVFMNDTLYNGANRIGTIQSYGDLLNGVYIMEYYIIPDSTSYNWRLMITGSGKFDEWSFDVVTANLADTAIYPALLNYKQPDLNSNIVSSFQCLDEVITVGAYINRNQIVDYDTILQKDTTLIVGDIADFSSHGPTRDGRIKPDISAPGSWILGDLVASLFSSYPHSLIGQGGFHRNSAGTSLSSPTVAGIAALYFQMDPNADWQKVKNAIINCARQDNFTGSGLPDNIWGYGKADAFAALTGCVTSSGEIQNIDAEELIVYPNPSIDGTFTFYGIRFPAQLHIYNVFGQKIYQTTVKRGIETVKIPDAMNGLYFCTLHYEEKIIAVKKLIISE